MLDDFQRTDEEILRRIEDIDASDIFGFERADLIMRLPFAVAKPYLNEDTTEEFWEVYPRDRAALKGVMLGYMPFAWDKANNFRGLSAGRSISHYRAWTWLAGDSIVDMDDYQYYGKDVLAAICNFYGWDCSAWDDGVRVNSEEELEDSK